MPLHQLETGGLVVVLRLYATELRFESALDQAAQAHHPNHAYAQSHFPTATMIG